MSSGGALPAVPEEAAPSPAPEPEAQQFEYGEFVRLTGLSSKSGKQLNGKLGRVMLQSVAAAARGRIKVRMCSDEGG
jgi:hypothetical protein